MSFEGGGNITILCKHKIGGSRIARLGKKTTLLDQKGLNLSIKENWLCTIIWIFVI